MWIKPLLGKLPVLALLAGAALPARGEAAGDVAFFERHIRPVLVEHCYECHSREAEKLKGGLRLDFRGGWEQGGDSGPALVPGKPDESLLVEAIGYRNPDLEMPPDHRLAPEIVANFRAWIARGAPDPRTDPGPAIASEKPRTIDLDEGRRFWSFRPVASPAPPQVTRRDWSRDPLDRFILAKLEEAGLQPAPDATPEALLRRLHHDLVGLLPGPAEIEQFARHYREDPEAALEAKADELLADPGFGERWGRHWLDIVRYADSSGGGRAIPLPDAWRFRDYVITAFNEDRPLDRLIREHLAGDLLPSADEAERTRNLTGTGFLVLGPHNYENQDKELLELEIVDEQLDTIGRAFLGMSIGCARCHDHKFDPVPTRDYYALAGIFTSTTSVKHSNVSAWHKEVLPRSPDDQRAHEAAQREIGKAQARLKELKAELARHQPKPPAAKNGVAPGDLAGLVLDDTRAELTGEWTPSTSVPSYVGAGYIHDNHGKKGEKSALFRPAIPASGEYEVRVSYSSGPNRSANTPVTVGHADGESTVRINQKKPAKHGRLLHSLGTFRFVAGKKGFIRFDTAGTEGAVIVDAVQLLPPGTKDPVRNDGAKRPGPPKPAAGAGRKIAELKAGIDRLEKQLKALRAKAPKAATIMAVTEAAEPADTQVRVRGMPRTLGARVPRGFLQVTR
ncbi:MAG: DUF1549 domain-containing protein, partial [Akkermansiaceae bacterium]|nr:DUF1549 domain-containing protein [Akkermansiaceae bacterium]